MDEKIGKMVEVDHDEMKQLVMRKYETGVPTFVWGAPGIGKSDAVRQASNEIAKNKGMEVSERFEDKDKFRMIDQRLAQMDPADIKGIPRLEGESTNWSKPDWFPTEGSGVIFFDELNLAPPVVQAAAYQVILDKRLGQYRLPEGFSVVAAGNRTKDRANTFEMPQPLLNRFSHMKLNPPSVQKWTNWAVDHDVDARIITFINDRKEMLFKFNPDDKTKAFPTPRSVTMVSQDVKGIDTENSRLIKKLAASSCGSGWASEFVSFLKLQEQVDLDNIINNPDSADLPTRADLCYAVSSGISEYHLGKDTQKSLKVAATVANRMQPEFGTLLLRMIKQRTDDFAKKIRKLSIWNEIAKKYRKYLLNDGN